MVIVTFLTVILHHLEKWTVFSSGHRWNVKVSWVQYCVVNEWVAPSQILPLPFAKHSFMGCRSTTCYPIVFGTDSYFSILGDTSALHGCCISQYYLYTWAEEHWTGAVCRSITTHESTSQLIFYTALYPDSPLVFEVVAFTGHYTQLSHTHTHTHTNI